jgi:hypothetical protein
MTKHTNTEKQRKEFSDINVLVIRECRRRLKPAFDKANIQFAERPIYQSMQMSN